jgi:hypothetical protein
MVRWMTHVACAGEMKGTRRVGSMNERGHFGDIDFGGNLIQGGQMRSAEKCVRIQLKDGLS